MAFSPEKMRATASLKSSNGLRQATTAEKSATVLRISHDQGGAIDVARMIEAFPLSLAKTNAVLGWKRNTLMQELNEVLVS